MQRIDQNQYKIQSKHFFMLKEKTFLVIPEKLISSLKILVLMIFIEYDYLFIYLFYF